MRKRSFSLLLITAMGICCGSYNIINNFEPIYLILGIAVIVLSAGIFCLFNIARIATIYFSFIFIILYFYLFSVWLRSSCQYFWGIGLMVHFPIFIWSVASMALLNLKKIKLQFKGIELPFRKGT